MKKLNKNTLYLEKMVCDFFVGDDIEKISDLNNYRYYIHNIELKNNLNSNKLKENKKYILDTLEVVCGARYDKNYNHTDSFGCWFHTYYYDNDNICYGLVDIDKELNKGNYNKSNIYTKKTILKLVNSISKNQYTNIEYIERF